jgi:hypothetical protein
MCPAPPTCTRTRERKEGSGHKGGGLNLAGDEVGGEAEFLGQRQDLGPEGADVDLKGLASHLHQLLSDLHTLLALLIVLQDNRAAKHKELVSRGQHSDKAGTFVRREHE